MYDLNSATFKTNIQQTYASLRTQNPIYCAPGHIWPKSDYVWYITRYEDAKAILLDHKRFVQHYRHAFTPEALAALPEETEVSRLLHSHLLMLDPPDHTRMRSLVSKAFTNRRVQDMVPRIQQIADELLDQVIDNGEMAFIRDFAFPFPTTVIAELMGLPLEDREQFRVWAAAMTPPATDGSFPILMQAFVAYIQKTFAERRKNPGNDLLTALIEAEEEGIHLSEEELVSMFMLLLVAGHETTKNSLANGLLTLLQHPDQLERLRRNPDLLPQAVEELLRFRGPAERATIRWAKEDVYFKGHLIRRGDPVYVVFHSANHDDTQFDNPEQLDFTRPANRHLGFGLGVHYCLGAPLGRLETIIGFKTILSRLPNMRLRVPFQELTWRVDPLVLALDSLPLAWDPPTH